MGLRRVALSDPVLPGCARRIEVAQRYGWEILELAHVRQNAFNHRLGAAVRADRLDGEVLAKGLFCRLAVDGAGRREHEGPHAMAFGRANDIDRAGDIVVIVERRLDLRVLDLDQCGAQHDCCRLVSGEDSVEPLRIANVGVFKLAPFQELFVTIGQIVDHHRPVSGFCNGLGAVASDIAGASNNEHSFHGFTFPLSRGVRCRSLILRTPGSARRYSPFRTREALPRGVPCAAPPPCASGP